MVPGRKEGCCGQAHGMRRTISSRKKSTIMMFIVA
jgi:hypothetical protein